MGTNGNSHDAGLSPLSDASDSEVNALVDEVLRSGKHLTIPSSSQVSAANEERFHASMIAHQMKRLAQRIGQEGADTSGEPDDVDEWWFELEGKRVGPISLRKARYLWEEGELTPESLCWHDGFTNWVYLYKVSELAEALAPKTGAVKVRNEPPPLPAPEPAPAWTPSAGAELEEERRKRLESTQKTAPAVALQQMLKAEAPAPLEQTSLHQTLTAQPAPAAPVRAHALNAVLTGLVSGLVVAGALFASRMLWPETPAKPAPQPQAVTAPVPLPSPGNDQPKLRPLPPAQLSRPQLGAARPTIARPRPPVLKPAMPAPSPDPVEPAQKPKPVDEAFESTFSPPDALEQSEILEVAAKHKSQVDACIAAHKETAPGATGRLVIRWKVSTDGLVSDVQTQTQEFAGTKLSECLKAEVATWHFPRHEVPHDPIDFPFSF